MANIITDTSITLLTSADEVTYISANVAHNQLQAMMVEIQAHHNGALTHDGNLNIVGNLQENSIDAVTVSGSATLTNKTINANNNTISNLEHGAEVDNPTVAHGATGAVVGTTNTQTLTNKSLGSGTSITLGSDADGDIYYRNSGVLTRLAKEYDGDRLVLSDGIPSWQRPKWSFALQLGNDLFLSGAGVPALAALNSTDVAFIDSVNDDLRTYRFNGSTWSQVGSDLNIGGSVANPALAALNSTDVAFIDDTNDDLRTYRFNGSTWSQVGSDLNITSVSTPALAALNSTDVAFIDGTNDDLRTYRFNGSTWSQVGSDLNISTVDWPAITALNSTDIAFIDNINRDLRTYRFNGSTWSQVGNDLNISTAATPSIAALNSTDIAFIDSTNSDLRIYRFDGTDWTQTGNDLNISAISGNLSALAALDNTDIAFFDATNDDLRTYRWL